MVLYLRNDRKSKICAKPNRTKAAKPVTKSRTLVRLFIPQRPDCYALRIGPKLQGQLAVYASPLARLAACRQAWGVSPGCAA